MGRVLTTQYARRECVDCDLDNPIHREPRELIFADEDRSRARMDLRLSLRIAQYTMGSPSRGVSLPPSQKSTFTDSDV